MNIRMNHDPHRQGPGEPSPWILRFADRVTSGTPVLDLAAGGGRHTRLWRARGHPVTAVDRDVGALAQLRGDPWVEVIEADLEEGPWPLAERRFGLVLVTNYLWRPLLPRIVVAVAPGGVLLYETFAVGNERFGRPANPAFLLKPGELMQAVAGRLGTIAYEHLEVASPRPAMVQRIAAVNEASSPARP